jgi:ubiquinone/menaquinone biosynthesis C-methylase UbiE
LLKERLRRLILGRPVGSAQAAEELVSAGIEGKHASQTQKSEDGLSTSYARHSHALEQFACHIRANPGLSILDLGGVRQANVTFITELGHKLYAQDFLRSFSEMLGDSGDRQDDQQQVAIFVEQNLNFPDAFFDGMLIWDLLEFLPPLLLKETVSRLFRIGKPGCHLLTLFHAEERSALVPAYAYRILSQDQLSLISCGLRQPVQVFNNRSIEKLFQQFQSVKFFLTRDQLREVIVLR